MSEEIELVKQVSFLQNAPDPIAAIERVGEMYAKSGMFGCTKVEQGQILALACMTEGMSPFEIMRTYHIIGGKLEMKAAAMLAKFRERGGKCRWLSDLNDRTSAKAEFEYQENKGVQEYTIKDAEAEGLTKAGNVNWEKSLPDMLRARLASKVIRMYAPEINSGIYDRYEAGFMSEIPSQSKSLLSVEEVKGVKEEKSVEEELGRVPVMKVLGNAGVSEDQVTAFLTARDKLKPGQPLDELSDDDYEKIIQYKEAFIEGVKGF